MKKKLFLTALLALLCCTLLLAGASADGITPTRPENGDGTIENCTNSGSVSGYGHVGGVCGSTGHSTVNCGNTGSVCGSDNVGGV